MYVHFDDDFNIVSISNQKIEKNCIAVDEQTYNDFNNGVKLPHDFKVAKDIRSKGKYYIVPLDFESQMLETHSTGIVSKTKVIPHGIHIIQEKDSWTVNNLIEDASIAAISAGEDYIKEYYVVSAKNRFVLFDKFSINLKDFVLEDKIVINGCSADKDASILTYGSHIPHIHSRNK